MASKIEWTEATWNPTSGCTKLSSGCKNCYAEAMAKRLQAIGTVGYEDGFHFSIVPSRLHVLINSPKLKRPINYRVLCFSTNLGLNK